MVNNPLPTYTFTPKLDLQAAAVMPVVPKMDEVLGVSGMGEVGCRYNYT